MTAFVCTQGRPRARIVEDLNRWLVDHAVASQKADFARTYLVLLSYIRPGLHIKGAQWSII